MGPTGCSETSVTYHQSTIYNRNTAHISRRSVFTARYEMSLYICIIQNNLRLQRVNTHNI